MGANMEQHGEVITLTFGECAENHKGMEIIGQAISAGEGFQCAELEAMEKTANERGAQTEFYTLDSGNKKASLAYVLVIRNGVDILLMPHGADQTALFAEQRALPYDKKALMYGRVVNKNARWNLCFNDVGQEPDYAIGKGCVIPFESVPLLQILRNEIATLHDKARDLKVESNYYYDAQKCGIGFHGDTERKKVIGVRLGTVGVPIYYQWYYEGEAIGDRLEIELHPGDIYVMSEKAAGSDWKRKTIPTLRHAVGKQFNQIK
jgi:alkylated DNA repair dioxygenase AlkB